MTWTLVFVVRSKGYMSDLSTVLYLSVYSPMGKNDYLT